MKWKQIPLGPLQTNCFTIYTEEEGIVIDPGGDADKLTIEGNSLGHRPCSDRAIA